MVLADLIDAIDKSLPISVKLGEMGSRVPGFVQALILFQLYGLGLVLM